MATRSVPQTRFRGVGEVVAVTTISLLANALFWLAAPWAEPTLRALGLPLPEHSTQPASSRASAPTAPTPIPAPSATPVRPGSIEAIRLSFLRWTGRGELAPEEIVGRLGLPPEVIEAGIRESLEARRFLSRTTTRPRPDYRASIPITAFYVTRLDSFERRFDASIENTAHDWSLVEAVASFQCEVSGLRSEIVRVVLPEIVAGARHDISARAVVGSSCTHWVSIKGGEWVLPPGALE